MARSSIAVVLSLFALADCSCATSGLALKQKISANAALRDITRRKLLTCHTRLRNPSSCLLSVLKSESRLITHGDAIEDVARWSCGSVSLGAFIKTAKRLRADPHTSGRCNRHAFSYIDPH